MEPLDADRQRALAILRHHGWTTVSFQLLEAEFSYWFDTPGGGTPGGGGTADDTPGGGGTADDTPGGGGTADDTPGGGKTANNTFGGGGTADDTPGGGGTADDNAAFVAYVDTGAAWVAGGGPIAPAPRLAEVAARFVEAAAAAGRRACFFGCEERFVAASQLPALMLGEQPVWSPAAWDDHLASHPSLRAQLRRARNKGVTTRVVDSGCLTDPANPLRAAILELGARWLATRRMAPMGFLVQLEPLRSVEERLIVVAEQRGELVGFVSAVPVYLRERLFVEDLVRDRRAPNGTIELLVDAAMRAAAARGDQAVTLGLAPLAGAVSPLLRFARAVSSPLYDFRGLHAFKAKLRPHHWEPIYLCAERPWLGLHDGLAAFTRGDLVGFGVATLARRPRVAAALVAAAAAIAAIRRGYLMTPAK